MTIGQSWQGTSPLKSRELKKTKIMEGNSPPHDAPLPVTSYGPAGSHSVSRNFLRWVQELFLLVNFVVRREISTNYCAAASNVSPQKVFILSFWSILRFYVVKEGWIHIHKKVGFILSPFAHPTSRKPSFPPYSTRIAHQGCVWKLLSSFKWAISLYTRQARIDEGWGWRGRVYCTTWKLLPQRLIAAGSNLCSCL